MWTQVRSLRRADEFQRISQLEALAIGVNIVGIVAWIGAFAVRAARAR